MQMDTGNLTLMALRLSAGAHEDPSKGMCLMEAVAYAAGEPHTDNPQCCSPILSAFGRGINDKMPDDPRQLLKSFIPTLIGTRGDLRHDVIRSYIAVDRGMRIFAPECLDRIGWHDQASDLRDLPMICSAKSARKAGALAQRFIDDIMDTSADPRAVDVADAIDDVTAGCHSLAQQAYANAAINAAYTAVFGAHMGITVDTDLRSEAALIECASVISTANEISLSVTHKMGFSTLTPSMVYRDPDIRAITGWGPALQLFQDMIGVTVVEPV